MQETDSREEERRQRKYKYKRERKYNTRIPIAQVPLFVPSLRDNVISASQWNVSNSFEDKQQREKRFIFFALIRGV